VEPHAAQEVRTAGRPLGEGSGAMIMVHGRGAGPDDILELAEPLFHAEFTYLAPAAAGNAWYPYSFMAPIETNEPGLSSGLYVLERLVRQVEEAGVPRERTILLGFSQGACLASEFAVRHAGRYGGVVALSGGLIGPSGTTWNQEGSFDGTPVFFGCSDVDAHVPRARVDESAEVFSRMGAEVTRRIYSNMGHLVNEDELVWARELVERVAG